MFDSLKGEDRPIQTRNDSIPMRNENVVQENRGLQNEIEEESLQIKKDRAESDTSGLQRVEIEGEIKGFQKEGIWHSQRENDEVVRNPQGQDGWIEERDWGFGEEGRLTRSGRRKLHHRKK
jgi:hypothetical protein